MAQLVPPPGQSDLSRDPEASRSVAAGQTQAQHTGACAPMTAPTDSAFQEAHTIRPSPAPRPLPTGLHLSDPAT